jgi:peptide/nickel transport system substrate-binding protein
LNAFLFGRQSRFYRVERYTRAMIARNSLVRNLILFLVVLIAVVGCTASAQPPPKRDVLTIGIASPIYTLNPVTMTLDEEENFARFIWAGLLGVDAHGHLFPILAQTVPSKANGLISADGRSITFILRSGLHWSDGTPLTATDVRFGWQLAIQPHALLCPATCWVIRDVHVQSPTRVIFQLSQPFSPLLFDLPPVLPHHALWRGTWAATFAHLYQPKDNFLGPHFAVDGPYQVRSATKTTITFVRNPFWTVLTRPAYARVVVHIYKSVDALLDAAHRGVVDLSQDYGLTDFIRLDLNAQGLHVIAQPVGIIEHLEPNLLSGPLQDVRVRQALSLAIDRQQLLEQAFALSPTQARRIVAYGPEVHHRFDPIAVHGAWDPLRHRFVAGPELADAGRLLDLAGWHVGKNGFRYRNGRELDLQLYTPYQDGARLLEVNQLSQMWQRIGVAVTPVYWPVSGMIANYAEGGPCSRGWDDLCLFAQFAQYDPQTDFALEFTSNHIARIKAHPTRLDINYPGIQDPLIDHVFAQAGQIYNLSARAALYRIWQLRVVQNADWIVLYERPAILLSRTLIHGLKPTQWGVEWDPWALAPAR